MHDELRRRTRELIAGCECEHGCPTCVGPVGNTGPLAKLVALRILELLHSGAMTPRAHRMTTLSDRLRGVIGGGLKATRRVFRHVRERRL